MTPRQKAVLENLCAQTHEEFPGDDQLNKAQAAKEINRLREKIHQPTGATVSGSVVAAEGDASRRGIPDPSTWTTAHDPPTEKQVRYLKVLARKTSEPIDRELPGMDRAEASRKIDELSKQRGHR